MSRCPRCPAIVASASFAVAMGLLGPMPATGAAAPTSTGTAQGPSEHGQVPRTPAFTKATFADPPASVRPKYFWWMPLANTSDGELRAEARQMATAGAGGAVIVPQRTNDRSKDFLKKYGWGTPLWRHKVKVMLAAAHANGIQVDFSQGPLWPAMVPTVSNVNDPRAMQQLVFSYETDTGGTTRTGQLPSNFDVKPPAGADKSLVAVLAARCEKAACAHDADAPQLLDHNSVVDVTDKVDDSGDLNYRFPGDSSRTYALMAFYQTATGAKKRGVSAEDPLYLLDYLSVAGAKTTTNYFDKHIITPAVQSLINKEGGAGFYDNSLELGSGLKWTSEFMKEFHHLRGYSLIRDLPALSSAADSGGVPASPTFDFGDSTGKRIRYDYLHTLSDLYITNHLDTFRKWAHKHDMYTRAQPYGPPIDMPEASSNIDVPGGESLAFGDAGHKNRRIVYGGDTIEDYKKVAVGAHMSSAPLVSAECCEVHGQVWGIRAAKSDNAFLFRAYDALAGGANRLVLHGFPYLKRSSGPQSRWPGMSFGGNKSWSAAYGANRNPNWSDFRRINDNLARLGLVLRQGKPRFDVAIYGQNVEDKPTGQGLNWNISTTGGKHNKLIRTSSAMDSAGYTYEYLSPQFLRRPDATFQHGHLFSQQSAYHALVVNNRATMPVYAARKVLHLAKEGLPVVIIGGLPKSTPGYDNARAADHQLHRLVAQLVAQPSVRRVTGEADVPAALRRAEIRPAAAHHTASPAILSVRRHTDDTEYYYLYNQTPTASDQTITLRGHGIPYRLDTWTGKIARLGRYARHGSTITVPVHLHGHDTTVIAISHGNPAFEDASSPRRPHAPASTARLSVITPSHWSLTVDSWGPDKADEPGVTRHTKAGPVALTTDHSGALPAWPEITPGNGYAADLQNVSGIGTYTTHVRLGPHWSPVKGAQLNLGQVDGTSRVSINGHHLPPLDYGDLTHIPVGRYLRKGENTITVRVASNLINAVRVAPGTGATGRAREDYGLVGPVTLTPMRPVAVEALERALPLAARGFNHAHVKVTNNTRHAQTVTVAAAAPTGVTASPESARIRVGPDDWTTVGIDLRNHKMKSGAGQLRITARGKHGTARTAVQLRYSQDLARNDVGTPFPRVFASGQQDHHPPELATDSSPSGLWVSSGLVPGQGPSTANPIDFGVDLGAPTKISAVAVTGHSKYGPTDFQVQTSNNDRIWTTVASENNAPRPGITISFPTVTARYVRLHITDSGDPTRPPRNVQISDFEVFGPPTPSSDLLRTARITASSTHPGYSAATTNDGRTDSTQWGSGPGDGGWNDDTPHVYPDTLTATWAQPVSVSRVRIYTLDSAKHPAARYGIRDAAVQVKVSGKWKTVAHVHDNTGGVIERSFAPTKANALRIVISDSNDHHYGYSRIVEVEAYAH